MQFEPHPLRPDWKIGAEVDTRDPPPASPEDRMKCLFGAGPGDWEPRLYLVPEQTPHVEVMEFFEVGTFNAVRHGWDETETTDLVSNTVASIHSIVPGTIELATSSELRLRFWRQIRLDELEDMEAVYKKVDDYQAGLERYLNGITGNSILSDVRETGQLHLIWR